jgi:inorganic triphosphatase YgiF
MARIDGTEIELKLALASGRLAALASALGDARLQRTSLEDVYFDTADRRLRSRGLVLRLRREDERWLQTLKASAPVRDVLPARGEWEVALRGRSVPTLDLTRFGEAARRLLQACEVDAKALRPVFGTRVTRDHARLAHGVSDIEIVLDRGGLRATVGGRVRVRAIAEVELELKAGRPDDVLDFGLRLVDRPGCIVVPSLRSKAERGQALAAGVPLDVVRAAARGFAAHIASGMPTAAALRAVVRHGVAVLVANADALRDAPLAEHVHQARVALRRMRAAIRSLDADASDVPRPLVAGLRRLGRALGDARDWDVIVDHTLAADDDGDTPPRRQLRRAADRARDKALARAIAAVSSRRYARLVLSLARWTLSTPATATPLVRQAAPALLEEAADRLYRDARGFARLPPRERHRVRIDAKRLRYALDVLAPALPARATADYVEALSALQDTLGELNDARVAAERLSAIAPKRADRIGIARRLRAGKPALVARASRELSALARRPRPWRHLA